MARPLAIERKAVLASADLDDSGASRMEGQRLGREAGRRGEFGVGRLDRVLGERGEDVGQEQFLMLLLMVDAELDQLERRRRQIGEGIVERFVDTGAPLRGSRRATGG